MKYNQNSHKQFVRDNLVSLMESVGMDSASVDTVTFMELRKAINNFYTPFYSGDQSSKPAEHLVMRKRKQLINTARFNLYAYKTIVKREENAGS